MFIVNVLVGLLMIFKPEIVWKLTESWKSYNADEPSSLYKWSTRFGGIIFLSIGMIGIVVTFLFD